MSDVRLRGLERAARSGGDEDRARLLRERLRVGDVPGLASARLLQYPPAATVWCAALLGNRAARLVLGWAPDGTDVFVSSDDPCLCAKDAARARGEEAKKITVLGHGFPTGFAWDVTPVEHRHELSNYACLGCAEWHEVVRWLPEAPLVLVEVGLAVARAVLPVRSKRVFGVDLSERGCGDALCCPKTRLEPSDPRCRRVEPILRAIERLVEWVEACRGAATLEMFEVLTTLLRDLLPDDGGLAQRRAEGRRGSRRGPLDVVSWWTQPVLIAIGVNGGTTRLGWALRNAEEVVGPRDLSTVRDAVEAQARTWLGEST